MSETPIVSRPVDRIWDTEVRMTTPLLAIAKSASVGSQMSAPTRPPRSLTSRIARTPWMLRPLGSQSSTEVRLAISSVGHRYQVGPGADHLGRQEFVVLAQPDSLDPSGHPAHRPAASRRRP